MQKTLLILAALSLALLAVATPSLCGIAGSKHDLTVTGASPYKTTSISNPCLICHNTRRTGTEVPIWNRAASTAVYQMYASATMDMTTASTPQAYSAACLSCHDGTVAFDTLVINPGPAVWSWNAAGNIMTKAISGADMLGTDLRREHPISITYDTMQDRAFAPVLNGAVNGLPLYGTNKNLVECSSCHAVHDNTYAPFLRVANTGSTLCYKCHLL